MPEPICTHEDFVCVGDVKKIVELEGSQDVIHTVIDLTVACAECGASFGFKGPLGGHSWDEPRCSIDALTIHLPLMSPTELVLAGPFPVMSRGPMVIEVLPRSRQDDPQD